MVTGSRRLGAVTRVLVVVTSLVAMAVGLIPLFAVGVVAVFLRDDLAVTESTIGLLPSALFVVGAVASPVAGRIVDRWPICLSLAVLFTGAVVTWLWFTEATTVVGAVASLGAAGITLALSVPVISRAIYEAFSGRARGWALGIAHTGSQAGAVLVGALLPGLSLTVGWRRAMSDLIVVPLGGLGLTVLLVCLSPRFATRAGEALVRARDRPRISGLGPMIGLAAVANASATSVALYLPVFAVEVVGTGVTQAGYLIVAFAVVSGIGKVVWGRVRVGTVGEQTRAVRMLTLLGGAGVIGIMLAPVTGDLPLWSGTAVFGITVTCWTVLCTRIGVQTVGPRDLGAASARIMAVGYLAGAIGPVVFGMALERLGPATGWTSMLLGLLVSAALVRPRPRESALPMSAHEN